ncbi:MAG: 50S ribosomal protein L13 [Acidobacteriota bacterium]
MKTYFPCRGEIKRDWWVADASGQTLGRFASRVAQQLRGKTKPTYTPFLDVGDFVIVVNAARVRLTGRKMDQKVYHRHSGYPGGLKSETAGHRMERDPAGLVRAAVTGMLPHTRLGRQMAGKLKVYAGSQHPHQAQRPAVLPLPDKAAKTGPATAAAKDGEQT